MFKIIVIVAALAPVAATADCSSNPELCKVEFDETSLLQLSSVQSHQQRNASEDAALRMQVEDAQDAVKAADSNATIQKYASSVARRHKAEAIYTALKKQSKAEHDTAANVKAVRAAATALQAAKDEEDSWKAAMQASDDAAAEAKIADADAAAKHQLRSTATAAHQQAMSNLSAARTNLTDTQIVQQQLVNDAAAEAHAQFALSAKQEAAKARAQQKEAQKQFKEEQKQDRLAWKKEMQTLHQARSDELKAHSEALSAQRSAEKGAAAGIMQQEATAEAAPAAAEPPMLLQTEDEDEEDEENVTMATMNNSVITSVKASADTVVQGAEAAVDQALSDEKKAAAAAQIAKYAAGKAAISKKVATAKQDSAASAALHAQHLAAKAARAQRAADDAIKQANFTLNMSSVANTSAGLAADIAESSHYKQMEAVRSSTKSLADAKLNYSAAYKNATLQKIMDEATADAATANDAASTAATSRAVADYAQAFEANASANKSAALDNLTLTNAQAHQANKIARQAHRGAAHAAAQAQKYDRKAAGVTLVNKSEGATTVVEE